MNKNNSAQAAVELMVILAVSLIAVISITSFSTNSVNDLQQDKLVKTAQNSVIDLSRAAKDVYSQGIGAKKRVFYQIPKGLDKNKSGLEDESFVLNVLGTDIFESAGITLTGSLPLGEGGHYVWVEAKEGYVLIGSQLITTDKGSIYATMLSDSNASATITITNDGNSNADVNIIQVWTSADVTLTFDQTSFTINSATQNIVTLDFVSNSSATGIHTGTLTINSQSPDGNDSLIIPVTAEIVLGEVGSFLISPSTRTQEVAQGGIDNNSITVCNTTGANISTITLTANGTIAGWISGLTDVTNLGPSDCTVKNYTLTVPGGQSLGEYSGNILGIAGATTDQMDFNITVIESSTMAESISFTWMGAEFSGNNKIVGTWGVTNNGLTDVNITRMNVLGWWERDSTDSLLNDIDINNVNMFTGSSDDNEWSDITDYIIPSGETASTNNELKFSGNVNNEEERFKMYFEFSDSSLFETPWWPYETGVVDFNFSWTGASFNDSGKDLAFWTIENLNDENRLVITRMKVSKWSENDDDNAKLKEIELNNDNTWSGAASDGNWVNVEDFSIPANTSYQSTDTELEFDDEVDDDGEQFQIVFEFSDNTTFTTPTFPDINTVDLWEIALDSPQPLDWSSDINSTANTYGRLSGNDGWDFENDTFSSGTDCYLFNADPNDDNSSGDSTVGSQNELRVKIGDYDNDCENSGNDASASYGVQFEITSGMYAAIQTGAIATLSFDWTFDDHGLDSEEESWIKARFTSPSSEYYLGSDLDNGDDAADATNDVYWGNDPNDSSDTYSNNVASWITSAGTYYLEIGGQVDNWENNEWLEVELDDLDLVISK